MWKKAYRGVREWLWDNRNLHVIHVSHESHESREIGDQMSDGGLCWDK